MQSVCARSLGCASSLALYLPLIRVISAPIRLYIGQGMCLVEVLNYSPQQIPRVRYRRLFMKPILPRTPFQPTYTDCRCQSVTMASSLFIMHQYVRHINALLTEVTIQKCLFSYQGYVRPKLRAESHPPSPFLGILRKTFCLRGRECLVITCR